MKTIFFTSFRGILMLGCMLHLSCDSFVETGLPTNQLTGEAVFNDKTTADAAMRAVYASIRDSGLLSGSSAGLSAHLGCYADELDFYGSTSNTAADFYDNSVLPLNAGVKNFWNTTYRQIYGANAIYEGVSQSTGIAQPDAEKLKGEALFVRALLHLYLVNLFGDIPYITTTDYVTNSHVSRMASDEVYLRIIEDLEMATSLLPEEYEGFGRARPNKFAAQALLARAYLYSGAWAEATNSASAVLNQIGLYADEPDVSKVFLKECTETIWQLPPTPEGRHTAQGATFTLLAAPPQFVALTPDLVDAFAPGDLRRTHWISSISGPSGNFFYASKYKQYVTESASKEYTVVLRTAEIYLIRAEARARQGELTSALEDLNHVRVSAGLNALDGLGQQQIVDAIFQERRLELFTEFGHRFFDLKRAANVDEVLGSVKPGWDTTDRFLPIPESEISANPNLLPQNPGY